MKEKGRLQWRHEIKIACRNENKIIAQRSGPQHNKRSDTVDHRSGQIVPLGVNASTVQEIKDNRRSETVLKKIAMSR